MAEDRFDQPARDPLPRAARAVTRPSVAARPSAWSFVGAAAATGVVTAIGMIAYRHVAIADLAMLYLIAIMLASRSGRGPSLLAASLAVAAFDFCFVPPRFTFAVADVRYWLTFGVMFGCGLVISTLTVRLRRQEEAALRARTEELRSSLLSAVSHDLRTPLAVITGAATSLRDDGARMDPEARAGLLSSIIDDARRLERVLANLLQLTRVETGFEPACEWVPADELVGAALTRLEATLQAISVDVDVEPELLLWIDPVLFEQLLINLLENALKHAQPPLAIHVRDGAQAITLEVADRGDGLVEPTSRLFEKHVRASSAPGAGLGLAVVRAIVVAHGGSVVAENRPGGGALFRVQLPHGPPPPRAEVAA